MTRLQNMSTVVNDLFSPLITYSCKSLVNLIVADTPALQIYKYADKLIGSSGPRYRAVHSNQYLLFDEILILNGVFKLFLNYPILQMVGRVRHLPKGLE